MRTLPLLAQLLGCPVCESELEALKEGLSCTSCRQSYPTWAGLPWLFHRPKEYRADWSHRLRFYVQSLERDVQTLKIEQKIPDLLPATGERLRLMIQAKIEQQREIEKLCQELEVPDTGTHDLHTAVGTPLPENQSLLGYYANVLRDWGWGEAENEQTAAFVADVIGPGSLGVMAVLGSGPSRLAYDLHRLYPGTTTLALDINPFYLLVAARMISGKTLSLQEFPLAPRDLRSFAVKVKCKAPEPVKENFHLLLADATQPCFKPSSLDTLLTPWLIDVLPLDLRSFARRLNRSLKMGGRWVNFGSLVFHQALQSRCYSREEVLDIVKESGFELVRREDRELPYLQAPHNCQKRLELLFAFSARKIREVELQADIDPTPQWLKDEREIIPAWPELQQQVFINHSLAVILAQVNGQRSLQDLSQLLVPQMGMSAEQIQPILRRVLGKAWDQRVKARSF
jgi:uncharacterized protein YbaR (Trm112 family)